MSFDIVVDHCFGDARPARNLNPCDNEAPTKISSYQEFLLGDLMLRAAYIWMTECADAAGGNDLAAAMPQVLAFFRDLLEVLTSDNAVSFLADLVLDRVWSAVQILACAAGGGVADGNTDLRRLLCATLGGLERLPSSRFPGLAFGSRTVLFCQLAGLMGVRLLNLRMSRVSSEGHDRPSLPLWTPGSQDCWPSRVAACVRLAF